MSNILIITKQTGNFFSLALNDDEVVISDQNRLTTVGNFCHFKTANGANIIKEQNVLFSEVTLITSGSTTFASINALWVGLINAGFFAGYRRWCSCHFNLRIELWETLTCPKHWLV